MNLPSWLGEGARHYLRQHSSYFALVCAGVYFQPLVSVRLRGYRNWVGIELVMHELLVLPIRPASVAIATPINSPSRTTQEILRAAAIAGRADSQNIQASPSPAKRVKRELTVDFD